MKNLNWKNVKPMMKQFHDECTQDEYDKLWNTVWTLAAYGFDDAKALFEKWLNMTMNFLINKEGKKMKKQDFIRAIEIHKELGDFKNKFFEIFNGCEASIVLTVLDTVIDDLIDLKSFIEKSIGGNKNG